MRPSHTDLSDLSLFADEVAGPEDVSTRGHAAALIWLLEEAGGGHGADTSQFHNLTL